MFNQTENVLSDILFRVLFWNFELVGHWRLYYAGSENIGKYNKCELNLFVTFF